MTKYLIVLERAKRNYSAYSPDVPGCVATGRTVEATVRRMRQALELHFEAIAEDGEAIPEPTATSSFVEVDLPKGPKRKGE